jgi:hypothetical protein
MKKGFRIPKNEINGRHREMLLYYRGIAIGNEARVSPDDGCFDPDEDDDED